MNPEQILEKLNLLAGKNGIGRVDLVENRFIGIKSRVFMKLPEVQFYILHIELLNLSL